MKKLLLPALIIGMFLTVASAYADFSLPTGPYVAAEGGYAYLLTPSAAMNSGGNYTRGDFGWGVNAGYNWGLDTFSTAGIEAGYNDNGQSKYNASGASGDTGTLTFDSKSWDILATFMTFWNNGVFFVAKGGVAYVQQSQDLTAPVIINGISFTSSGNDNSNNFQPMVVLGGGYQLSPNFSLYSVLSWINGESHSDFSSINADSPYHVNNAAIVTLKVGLTYNF